MTAPRPRFDKSWLYRQSRMLHAYLSAFAFIALMLFSLSGLLLNHPDWFKGRNPAVDHTLRLDAAELREAAGSADPARALAAIVAERIALKGGYKSGEVIDGEAQIRFEGVSGKSDLLIDLASGQVEATVEPATVTTMLHDLHRGKNSGAAWSWVIDLTAVLTLAFSLLGYVLFFSLRFRLATSLQLTGVSLAVLAVIFFVFVP
ncbi:PepSY-associated TM helix domain-containing protein [Chitinimonas koreensis]|uniref:PepSY-associated TM helix domain-containing protein n=2 Tax=Chitinimonas koreensis TaxID=356302 RepID=UPI000424E347|nr:PepSY-associated TM helix domain-containing protein [Chitinimonas koreensis]